MDVAGAQVKEGWIEYVIAWFLSMLFASSVVGARVGMWLYGPKATEPPDDPAMYGHWRRRRIWIVISEFSSLPAFACLSIAAAAYWGLSPFVAIPISMLLAIVGFLLLLDGVQRVFRQKMGLPE